jgi:hypothetical protein
LLAGSSFDMRRLALSIQMYNHRGRSMLQCNVDCSRGAVLLRIVFHAPPLTLSSEPLLLSLWQLRSNCSANNQSASYGNLKRPTLLYPSFLRVDKSCLKMSDHARDICVRHATPAAAANPIPPPASSTVSRLRWSKRLDPSHLCLNKEGGKSFHPPTEILVAVEVRAIL